MWIHIVAYSLKFSQMVIFSLLNGLLPVQASGKIFMLMYQFSFFQNIVILVLLLLIRRIKSGMYIDLF